ncbi:MAG: 2-hydroxychromene-2-carboxylate isomerase [Alphaproteobacteria bacterium]|nr:2-hydroxychromene-2-carboxylate isomerase [Alphaproteobacteria bacterium]
MTLEFLFDFGSPNAYMAHKVIPEIEKRTGQKFTYMPVLLGGIFKSTNNKPPMVAFGGIKGKMEYEMLESQRFMARHKLTKFKFNPHFPVNTLLVMRAAVGATIDGGLMPYVDAVMRAMWEDGKKMDDPEIARAALDEAGLDGARVLARAQDADVKQKLMDLTANAVERGVFGIPTFFVGKEIYFGKNTLRDVEDEIMRVKSAA